MKVITVEEPDEQLDELERQLKEQLVFLQQQFQRAAKPIQRDLMRIHECRKRKYYMVPEEGDPVPALPAGILPETVSDERT
jgi:hypothetical protein